MNIGQLIKKFRWMNTDTEKVTHAHMHIHTYTYTYTHMHIHTYTYTHMHSVIFSNKDSRQKELHDETSITALHLWHRSLYFLQF